MKTVLVLCFVALAAARPDKNARIVNYQAGIAEDGSYDATYETTNGIRSTSSGISYPGDKLNTGNYVIEGEYSYVGDDGVTYTVRWTADENGFHPEGAHLPDFSHTREHIGFVDDHL
ncbi:cuticle protein CP14.6-like [Amphibalanus amphitrite]|uniref:cuticle protein CP14.6-like n=1 Tax=Amphibalanus amphitrite TaxID=1232801 RepID=UPI001C90B479|nr:cuticle protein CP14.6-like [Amphibalanus amphitrite]